LSVDPLAEKYPNMGGYVYCANNPVRFVDPDGKEIKPVGTAQEIKRINSALAIVAKTNPCCPEAVINDRSSSAVGSAAAVLSLAGCACY